MYSRFHLALDIEDLESICKDIGREAIYNYQKVIEESRKLVSNNIRNYILQDDVIDATEMQSSWFSTTKSCNRTHVFLSHKHRDLEYAEKFAAWLYKYFGIITFIDSFVWGNSYVLQKKLDNKFCKNTDKSTYSYEKRNFSTAHVHMMLANALTMMIDQCECFFWLDLNNDDSFEAQLSFASDNETITDSAWIYHEITTAQMIQRRSVKEYRAKGMMESWKGQIGMDSDLPLFLYHSSTNNLKTLSNIDLMKWQVSFMDLKDDLYRENPEIKATSALNCLYVLKNVTDKTI